MFFLFPPPKRLLVKQSQTWWFLWKRSRCIANRAASAAPRRLGAGAIATGGENAAAAAWLPKLR